MFNIETTCRGFHVGGLEVALWLVALVGAGAYSPKHGFEVGFAPGADRRAKSAHTSLGCQLMPVQLVRELWIELYQQIRGCLWP